MKEKAGARKVSMLLNDTLLKKAREILGAKTTTETVEQALKNTIEGQQMLEWLEKSRGVRKGKEKHPYAGE